MLTRSSGATGSDLWQIDRGGGGCPESYRTHRTNRCIPRRPGYGKGQKKWPWARRSDGGDARYFGYAVEPVALAQGEEPFGLGGEHVDGGLRLGLAVEDPVLVAPRADLRTLRGVGG